MTEIKKIRNFSIIAHIDHGKSTLADRLLEFTNALSDREKSDQFLDNMDIEKERGITIKAQTVRLNYTAKDGETYILNLIDTPGHVDFSYEVDRALASCEGAILVVDASQGVEAQTLANVYIAIENDLEIIPVLNKVDLPHASPEKVKQEIEDVVGLDTENTPLISAKTGLGVDELLEQIIKIVPAPTGKSESPLQALIFDSWFDPYQGVMVLVRVFSGQLKPKEEVYFKHSEKRYEVIKLGVFSPFFQEVKEIKAGEVGVIICGIKSTRDIKIGDTLVHYRKKDTPDLSGFKEVKPFVFSGIFPVDSSDYPDLKEAIDKLALNDSSFTFEPESSTALGLGFRCGFLGLLHMDIIQERLEREFGLNLINTAPSCNYKIVKCDEEVIFVDNPSEMPDAGDIEYIAEPVVEANIHLPKEFIGAIIKLCIEKRGIQKEMKYLTEDRVQLVYDLPLSEMIFDFYDQLKSLSKGYASLDYEFLEYRRANLVRVDVLITGDKVDALSLICHSDSAYHKGRNLVQRLQKIINRQQFDIPIQAAIGSRIISRETVKALRKNVLAKCYGGDISRKRKLLEKQKEGKKRMKMVGSVEIPQEAFLAVLKKD